MVEHGIDDGRRVSGFHFAYANVIDIKHWVNATQALVICSAKLGCSDILAAKCAGGTYHIIGAIKHLATVVSRIAELLKGKISKA